MNNSKNRRPVKDKIILLILSYLLGVFGIDRMYLGCWGTGLLKLFTIGGLGIWYTIDLLFVLVNSFTCDTSPSLCGGYVWNRTTIEYASVLSKIILVLFLIKMVLGFVNFGNNKVVIKEKYGPMPTPEPMPTPSPMSTPEPMPTPEPMSTPEPRII